MPVGTITFPTTLDTEETLSGAANNVTVLLDQQINSSQTTITVADATYFPAAGFATIVDSLTAPTKIEIISYTEIDGNTLKQVIRGAQGTTPQTFTTGYVEIRPTAGHHLALVDAVIAIENRLGTGSVLPLAKGGTGTAFTLLPNSDHLLFWDASAQQMRLLTLGTNLSITGTTINATGGGSTPQADVIIGLAMPESVFTVTPNSVTNNGVFNVTFTTQGANTVFAGPTTGAAATPAFRALVAADIPALSYVTSVGLSLPNIFTVSNSPVTSSGTLTATLAAQAENLVLVGPINAPAATPTFRLLEDEDIPNVLSIHKNKHLTTNGFVKTTNGDGTYAVDTNTYLTGNQTVTLSGDVTGSGTTAITATIANQAVTYAKIQNISATSRVLGRKTAGAGSAEELTLSDVLDFVGSAAQGDILYRGASSWTRLAAGTNGQYLQTQGAGANPQWATVVAGGSPGGSSGQVQFNSGGTAFGGSALFTFSATVSPNVVVTADAAGSTALRVVAASSPTASIFQVTGNVTTTVHFAVTSTGAPHSPGSGTDSLRYGSGSTATAARCTMIGVNATANATTGADNTVLGCGANAGRGSDMIIIGSNAGFSNSGYAGTVIIGKDAAKAGGSSGGKTLNSVAIGQAVAYSAAYFSNSILIGYYAGGNNGSHDATENVAIGYRGAISISTGSYNAWVGSNGGEGFDTGSYNTGLGYRASYLVGTGSSGTLASTICLGANAFPTASNQCVIGGANANGQINDVYVGSGVTFATPVNVTINASGGSGTNIAGANLNLAGGRGTGTGIPGTIGMQFARAGTTGSTANALSDEWRASYSTTDTVSLTAALKTSTTNLTEAARLSAIWTTATHASRTAKWQLQLVGNAAALATVAEFDMSTTAGDTRFLIYDVDNGTLERVTVGAADSGGTGFKVLRIPN